MPRKRVNKRGIDGGSRIGGWNATEKALSAEERWACRVVKRATADKRPAQTKRFQKLIWASTRKCDQLNYIGRVVQLAYGFAPKPEQLEALWWLLFEKQDLLLVAKTSFGKSVILQLLPCLIPDATVLILVPLNAIGAEQLSKIQSLPGTRPIHLNADNSNTRTLADIRCGVYTHILVSPEIACSHRFRRAVLSNSTFRARIKAVLVDEVHLVVDWGQAFRESYTHLRYLRNVLGQRPWFGCTATLDKRTFKALCYSSGFSPDVQTIRTTINRPEIGIIRKELPRGTKSSYRLLYFLIDDAAESKEAEGDELRPTPERIKKTVVFFDTKKSIRACVDTIRTWLEEKKNYSPEEANTAVAEYHATLAEEDKERLYNEFKKPDSKIRILVATDAIALGCDIPDIELAVQYGVPRGWNMNTVWQRFGRCARRARLTARAIFFVESRFVGPRETPSQQTFNRRLSGITPSRKRKRYSGDGSESESSDFDIDHFGIDQSNQVAARVERETTPGGTTYAVADMNIAAPRRQNRPTDAQTRQKLPEVLYEFCNSDDCLRNIVLSHYLEEGNQQEGVCCSNCQSDLAELAELEPPKKKRKNYLTGSDRHPIFQLMRGWCIQWVEEKWPSASFEYDPRIFISDDELMAISDRSWILSSVEKIEKHLSDWQWGSEALKGLLGALHQARNATHKADTVDDIKQRLPDWPWRHVRTFDLSAALHQTKSSGNRQRTQHNIQQMSVQQSSQQLCPHSPRPLSLLAVQPTPASSPIRQTASSRAYPPSTPRHQIQERLDSPDSRRRSGRRRTPKTFFDEMYTNPVNKPTTDCQNARHQTCELDEGAWESGY